MSAYNFDDMFNYVLNVLTINNGLKSKKAMFTFRNRFMHIKRVYGWAQRIMEGLELNKDAVLVAAIFHDCGYSSLSKDDHALRGAHIFKEYALNNGFDLEFTDIVYKMIYNHSNKELLNKKDTALEMIVLLEADLMDEEGALGLVFDLLAEGTKSPDSYETVFNEIMMHSAHILDQDFMVTPLAKKFWEEKKCFIREFIKDLKYDLFME